MGAKKKEKEIKEVEEIIERFKNLSTQELVARKHLFENPLSKPFKTAINEILHSRGLNRDGLKP